AAAARPPRRRVAVGGRGRGRVRHAAAPRGRRPRRRRAPRRGGAAGGGGRAGPESRPGGHRAVRPGPVDHRRGPMTTLATHPFAAAAAAAEVTTADVVLWVVLPYLFLTVFVLGHVWRYRYDKFGWTTRSSQLYERRLLRWASPLFHFGILFVFLG